MLIAYSKNHQNENQIKLLGGVKEGIKGNLGRILDLQSYFIFRLFFFLVIPLKKNC